MSSTEKALLFSVCNFIADAVDTFSDYSSLGARVGHTTIQHLRAVQDEMSEHCFQNNVEIFEGLNVPPAKRSEILYRLRDQARKVFGAPHETVVAHVGTFEPGKPQTFPETYRLRMSPLERPPGKLRPGSPAWRQWMGF